MRLENFAKTHSNELIAVQKLHDLRQGTLSLEEFIAKLRILVKEANYSVKSNDRFVRDFLVLGMNSDCVWKDCPSNTGKNNGFPFLDILGYLKNTQSKSQSGNFVGNSLVGTCLTLPNLGFLWVLCKYPKYPKMGIRYFFLWKLEMPPPSRKFVIWQSQKSQQTNSFN